MATVEGDTALWSQATRFTFRFCFVYFPLYSLFEYGFPNPIHPWDLVIPNPATHWPLRQIVFWVGAHVFGFQLPLVYTSDAGGDAPFDWVMAFCLAVIAIVAASVWSAVDRRRSNYRGLHGWMRLFVRAVLIAMMFAYGFSKVIPNQMRFPFLTTLVEPFGALTPQQVLWSSIGAAPIYEIFAGCAEVFAGLLLFTPRTTLFGALLCLADMIQVFVLNVAYGVNVKQFSFHLILMALFLLAPDLPRLANLFLLNRPVGPSREPQLFETRGANRIALSAQILFGLWFAGLNIHEAFGIWQREGGGRPEPPLYGIWDVQKFSIDGQIRAPLLGDSERWRRVVLEVPFPGVMFQRMDDSSALYGEWTGYSAVVDVNRNTLVLTNEKNWKAEFALQRAAHDELILDGAMDGHNIHAELRLFDRNKFPLVDHRFRWVQH
jgi:hypothetical protein